MSLKDKVALITGASSGIGRETAIALANAGAKVILFGGRNAEKLQETADSILKTGGSCKVVCGDLTDQTAFEIAFSQATDSESKIDILINNAGVAHNDKFETVTTELFEKIMKVNVQIPYFLTQKALPYLKKSDSATVINIASVVAHTGYENQSVYSASKHALLGFTKSIATELYKDNVRVHAISPGGVYTEMIKLTRPDLSDEGMILPKDIVDVIMFILTHRTNAVIDEIMIHRVGKPPFLV